ncbi:NAD+ kinase [Acetitomaculum ruminis DSM 5522]|uniref:NAD kinase n=1 Tax=Acetitomaculum ruminis DSM 5522 TaxID=1120918 RepID=A0A1I0VT07_9FIRM|nr:NAD(+)/NADH kinase [Acetitomaculum ruminis]SFA79422.1 NAD+ kinase [Acetitomaculum ruminis DSM 5522]
MKKFHIITNSYKDLELINTKYIVEYLKERGCFASFELTDLKGENIRFSKELIESDCIIVLGGDGTLLFAARKIFGMNKPLIGVNMGNMGYLCELELNDIENALNNLIDDVYDMEDRMMVQGEIFDNSQKMKSSDFALNDVVIHRGGNLRLLNFIIYVDDVHLCTYSADGIIIATPTGSTAYSMSAGGPIVEPRAQIILLTPINSHTISTKSIVISAQSSITVEIGEGRRQKIEEAMVSFDGKKPIKVSSGEKITVSRAKNVTRILKMSKISFLKTLHKKMQEYI